MLYIILYQSVHVIWNGMVKEHIQCFIMKKNEQYESEYKY